MKRTQHPTSSFYGACFRWYLQGADNTLNAQRQHYSRNTFGRFGSERDQCESTKSKATLACRLRRQSTTPRCSAHRTPGALGKDRDNSTCSEDNGQRMGGTRSHAICTTVQRSASVTLWREDTGGRSSAKTVGKYVKLCGVEKTSLARIWGYRKDS